MTSFFRFAALLFVALILASAASTLQKAVTYPPSLGFDRNIYPSDEAMKLLRRDFAFTGYWLGHPPGEKTNSWSGKREFLRSQGFGFLLLFTGPASSALHDDTLARKRAESDVQAAAASARLEGFTSGSVIFLDVEEGGRLPSTYITYLKTWASKLSQLGYRAGVYCSAIPVDEGEGHKIITSDFIRERIKPMELVYWVFNDSCPPSPGCAIRHGQYEPSQAGVAYAQVWQFARSPRDKQTARRCGGYAENGNCYAPIDAAGRFHLDLNVATSWDP